MSCTALFPRLGSSPLALALHFLLRGCTVHIPELLLLQHTYTDLYCEGLSPFGCRIMYGMPAPAAADELSVCCVSEVQLSASASLVVVTSMSRGRFLLSESPACDVSGLDVQCPPFTVQFQQLHTGRDNISGTQSKVLNR